MQPSFQCKTKHEETCEKEAQSIWLKPMSQENQMNPSTTKISIQRMLILKMSHLKFAARTISSIDNVLYTAWNISTKLVIIEFFDTLREVNIYIRGIWELIRINLLIDIFDILLDFLQMLWDCFINLGASATIFHKSRSVLPGLILNTGAKISDALNRGAKLSDAPSVWDFWERLWNVYYQKNNSKNLQYSDAPVSQTCTFAMGPGSGWPAKWGLSEKIKYKYGHKGSDQRTPET